MAEDQMFIEKHLARNIPQDFDGCCERIRLSLGKKGQPLLKRYRREYGGMLTALWCEDLGDQQAIRIGQQIDKIRIRYLAVQKTLDISVPAKPVHTNLRRINHWLSKALDELDDPDRDAAVEQFKDEGHQATSLRLQQKFEHSQNIAEKVTIIRDHLKDLSDDLDPIVDFFEYKRGLCTKGQPSKYALAYAVNALAALFDAENTKELKASVNHSINETTKTGNALKYSGQFLDFVLTFLWLIVPEQLSRKHHEAICDQIQSSTKKRKKDPTLYQLLDQPASVEDVLEFMKRADAIK
ncbi:MAG: hypothetical protein JXR13_13025 [Thalassovita sp.]